MQRQPRRTGYRRDGRYHSRKTSLLTQRKIQYVDYKDVNLLKRFMTDKSKIRSRRINGNSARQQREVANAIKNAREMALLPYTSRITSQKILRPYSGRYKDEDSGSGYSLYEAEEVEEAREAEAYADLSARGRSEQDVKPRQHSSSSYDSPSQSDGDSMETAKA